MVARTFRTRTPDGVAPSARRRRGSARRGAALIEVIIAGILLGIGLAVLMSLISRALVMQTTGEKHMTAAWLADELLAMVQVEGPDEYGALYDLSGRFLAPFEEYTYDVVIDRASIGLPYEVSAQIRWSEREQDMILVETLIADQERRDGDPEDLREPYETLDRDARNFDDETTE